MYLCIYFSMLQTQRKERQCLWDNNVGNKALRQQASTTERKTRLTYLGI